MARIDRSFILEGQGTSIDPTPPTAPAGNYFRILLTFQNSIEPMKAAGFLPGIVVNDMATGLIPMGSMAALEAIPDVIRVEIDRRINYHLEASRTEIQANLVQKPPQNSGVMGYDGSGVIVGIIDYGFDYRHKSFRKGDGTGATRILRLWQQQDTPWQPGLNYGTKYTSADIDSSIASFTDPAAGIRMPYTATNLHGTHVAGIAAGSGSPGASGGAHVGIAPKADLIVVQPQPDGTGGCVAEAVVYIAQQAQAMNKRAVINMSIGYVGFACDGYAPLDRLMNNIAAEYPHIVLVASAGNNGGYSFHAQGEVTAQPFNLPLNIQGNVCMVYLWYAATENYTLTVTPPESSKQDGAAVYDPQTYDVFTHDWPGGNQVSFHCETHPYNGKTRMAAMFRNGERHSVAPGQWQLSLAGPPSINGKVHAWIDFDVSGSIGNKPSFANATPASTLESPAEADKVIAVGSYITTHHPKLKPVPMGSLSFFSSRGPLLGPGSAPAARVKPDLCAPGHVIFSAKNGFATDQISAVTDGYVIDIGTSMASPHVVGVIALLLQKEPALTWQQVYDRVTQAARKDAQTGNSLPNGDWGFGKLDAWATLFPPAGQQQNAGGGGADAIVPDQFGSAFHDFGDALSRSPEGREYLTFFERHRDEVVALIRSHRRVATAWLRHGAPVAHALITHLPTPDQPLPVTLYGRGLGDRWRTFLRALARYGGADLRSSLTRLGDPLPADGLTWNQIRARFAAS